MPKKGFCPGNNLSIRDGSVSWRRLTRHYMSGVKLVIVNQIKRPTPPQASNKEFSSRTQSSKQDYDSLTDWESRAGGERVVMDRLKRIVTGSTKIEFVTPNKWFFHYEGDAAGRLRRGQDLPAGQISRRHLFVREFHLHRRY